MISLGVGPRLFLFVASVHILLSKMYWHVGTAVYPSPLSELALASYTIYVLAMKFKKVGVKLVLSLDNMQ